MAHAIMGMKNPQAEVLAVVQHMWERWVNNFGFPTAICSELGPTFEIELFTALSEIARAHRIFEIPPNLYLQEKFHRSVTYLISRYGLWQALHPTMFLSAAFFTYNTKLHSGTTVSPFRAF